MIASRLSEDSYRTLYPEIEPFHIGYLRVSSLHEIYFEESGNPQGKPVVWLHGGPGAGSSPWMRRLFDPKHYRIILFDQRGTGKSRPMNSLEENTTWHLVDDLEKLRIHLQIQKWMVMGGSWGSTLTLAYAQTYPNRVAALFVRSIFLGQQRELDWAFSEGGASQVFPEVWHSFKQLIPISQRGDLVKAYYELLKGSDLSIKQRAADILGQWESILSRMYADESFLLERLHTQQTFTLSLMEMHYSFHRLFFEIDGYLLKNINKIRHIPGVIAHGRYDMICPLQTAFELHQAWPEAEFCIIPDAGHTLREPAATHHALNTIDRFKSIDF